MNLPAAVGRYQVRSRIGEGGMGTLYLAWDPRLERLVAIKTLTRDDEDLRERFAREARAAAGLRHPNIVTIHDVGDDGGLPFIAMEYFQGETLETLIRETRFPSLDRRLDLLDQLCDGLAYAHGAGIVHRDVKPANLMVDGDWKLKILDFGIARSARAEALTLAGSVLGTVNYMSPEQLQGKPVDGRSDIFSVGAVAYELLGGRQAFPGTFAEGLYHRILYEDPPRLPLAATGSFPALDEIVTRALAKDPCDRFRSLAELLGALRSLRGGLRSTSTATTEVSSPPSPTWLDARVEPSGAHRGSSATPRWLRGRGRVIRLAMLLALGGLLAFAAARFLEVAFAVGSSRRPPRPAAVATAQPIAPDGASLETTAGEPADENPFASEIGRPRAPLPRGSRSASPAARATHRSAASTECVRLLERLSLGDTLDDRERVFLERNCRTRE